MPSIRTSMPKLMLRWEACFWDHTYGQCTTTLRFALRPKMTANQDCTRGKITSRKFIIKQYHRLMTLTGCSETEFTCHDGSCLPMEKRCDGKKNCLDGADEDQCRSIISFSGYNKFLVPEPMGDETSLQMNISVIINKIVAIDENNGYFKAKMTLIRNWYNPQLQYQNLKKEASKNQMTKDDIAFMWIPWTLLDNIEHKYEVMETDLRDIMTIIPNKEFKFVRGDKSNLENTMIFKGSENAINYEKQTTTNFICNYDMMWYPFDNQKCTIEMYHVEDTITINPVVVNYTGPEDLTQHVVRDVHICALVIHNRPGAIVEVILGRPLFGSVLTIFMPTVILVILSQMVGVFHKEYMDMVIGVNLTLLLVLATL